MGYRIPDVCANDTLNNRLNVNCNNDPSNNNWYSFGMVLAATDINMTRNLFNEVISFENLIIAWKKARKGKTKKSYVIKFEEELFCNLMALHYELKFYTYVPKPLVTFILRDPKTRVISKSDFRDRIIHHAIVNVLEPIFDKAFIYDSCANRTGKGNLFAIKRFELFVKKVSKNNMRLCFVLKADIKHYFQEIDHQTLLNLIKGKIRNNKLLRLIEKIVKPNYKLQRERERVTSASRSANCEAIEFQNVTSKGIPLGNLTSQFFANVYLNELDYFVKRELKAKYYIRYVDDFIVLNNSDKQLETWKEQINDFLRQKLKLKLHPEKSRVILLSSGIDFVGFRNFFYFRLLRKRCVRKMKFKINEFGNGKINYSELMRSFQGWKSHVKWANTYNLRKKILKKIQKHKNKLIRQKLQIPLRRIPINNPPNCHHNQNHGNPRNVNCPVSQIRQKPR
ncbi:MAG: reverse transcriptase/maturase family protein [archaeon]